MLHCGCKYNNGIYYLCSRNNDVCIVLFVLVMRVNALSVANYFVKLANDEHKDIHPLCLNKLVYIAHGFALALLDRSLLDDRFDRVEAWRYGPVIPSVYHSFKYKKRDVITTEDYAVVENWKTHTFDPVMLEDDDAKRVVRIVWNQYKEFTGEELVELLHQKGTPWDLIYKEGKNCEIPDGYTKAYYTKLIENILEQHG